jgi:hypothetical protein
MIDHILLIIGAVVVALWGIAHLFPTKGVVRDFGDISQTTNGSSDLRSQCCSLCFGQSPIRNVNIDILLFLWLL